MIRRVSGHSYSQIRQVSSEKRERGRENKKKKNQDEAETETEIEKESESEHQEISVLELQRMASQLGKSKYYQQKSLKFVCHEDVKTKQAQVLVMKGEAIIQTLSPIQTKKIFMQANKHEKSPDNTGSLINISC